MATQFTCLLVTVGSTKDLIVILNILQQKCNVFYKDIDTYSIVFDIQNDHIQKFLEMSTYIDKTVEVLPYEHN